VFTFDGDRPQHILTAQVHYLSLFSSAPKAFSQQTHHTMAISQSDGCTVHKLDASLSDTSLRKYTRLRTEAWLTIFHHDLLHAPMALKSFNARRKELQQPDYHCWVCVLPNPKTGATDLDTGVWAGLANMQGPCSEVEYNTLKEPSLNAQTEHLEMRWRPRGLYFRPTHRDPTLYAALYHELITWQQQQATQAAKAAGLDTVLIRQIWTTELGAVAHSTSTTVEDAREVMQLTVAGKLEYEGWMNEVALEELTEESHREPVCAVFEDRSLLRL